MTTNGTKPQTNSNCVADDNGGVFTVSDVTTEGLEMEEKNKNTKEKGEPDPVDVNKGDDEEEEEAEEEDDGWDDNDEDATNQNYISQCVRMFQFIVKTGYEKAVHVTRGYFWRVLFLVLYVAYFIYAMYKTFDVDNGDSWRLLICTILGVLSVLRHRIATVVKKLYHRMVGKDGLNERQTRILSLAKLISRWVSYAGLGAFIVRVLVDEAMANSENLIGLPGLFIMIFICLLCSTNPGLINWHTIVWSFGMQFIFAVLTLRVDIGRDVVVWLQDRLDEFFDSSTPAFLFLFGPNYTTLGLAFGILPLVFMMSATLSILYYLGVMQFVIGILGRFFSFVLDIHHVESVAVAGGIFVESLLALVAVRPFLGKATQSELFTILTSVYASLGGAFLAILKGLEVPLLHIIPAMVISAPATVLVCKLMVPENRPNRKFTKGDLDENEASANPLDAYQTGALSALALFGNVVAVTFAFFSAIEWFDRTFVWFGEQAGVSGVTMQFIFSYLLYPVALAMGVRPNECRTVAKMLGVRLVAGNLIAFQELKRVVQNRHLYDAYMNATNHVGLVTHDDDDIYLGTRNNGTFLLGGIISERSEVITTYSLCGFSSVLSMGIVMGSLFAFIPHRREWLSKMAFPALVAGNIANCMTGCFASLFFKE